MHFKLSRLTKRIIAIPLYMGVAWMSDFGIYHLHIFKEPGYVDILYGIANSLCFMAAFVFLWEQKPRRREDKVWSTVEMMSFTYWMITIGKAQPGTEVTLDHIVGWTMWEQDFLYQQKKAANPISN